MSNSTWQEVIDVFVAEALDLIDDVELYPITLIDNLANGTLDVDQSSELLNSVFRIVHTIKGNASTFQFNGIAALAHDAESLLDSLRSGLVVLDKPRLELLSKSLDMLRSMLQSLQMKKNEEEFHRVHREEIEGLIAELSTANVADKKAAQVVISAPVTANPETKSAAKATPVGDDPDDAEGGFDQETMQKMVLRFVQEADEFICQAEQNLVGILDVSAEQVPVHLAEAFRVLHSFKGNCGFMGYHDLEILSHSVESALQVLQGDSNRRTPVILQMMLGVIDKLKEGVRKIAENKGDNVDNAQAIADSLNQAAQKAPAQVREPKLEPAPARKLEVQPTTEPAQESAPTLKKAAVPEEQPSPSSVVDKLPAPIRNDIRIDARKLDSLVNLVGELVIAETMVTDSPVLHGLDDEGLSRAAHHLRRIIRELQDVSLSLRMAPLSGVFRKMMRLVHDASMKTGKKVRLELSGEDTELDKTLIEQISDPLVHVIRNAVDHGIEMPHERITSGKVDTGTVHVAAKHEGGEVWISIRDDGRGLDRRKIINKALERNLIRSLDEGNALSDEKIHQLVFEPGFSTAEKVTELSGRGVGMDVVKKNIEKLKGRVRLYTTPGQGTTVVFQIPLTLAIIEGMIVRVGVSKYTIPLLAINSTFRVNRGQIKLGPDGQEFVIIRDKVIPVVRLSEICRTKPDSQDLVDGVVILVETKGQQLCFFVDQIVGQQQTVIKGLYRRFHHLSQVISGCTILGNGEISLILDVASIMDILGRQYTKFTGHAREFTNDIMAA